MVFSGKKPSSAIETVIGEHTVCEGKLSCETNLRVEGRVNGEIECAGEVVIGEHAVVQSAICANEIFIAGTVHGDVSAKSKLTILPTGQLVGNINADSLQVLEGGVFLGSCTMTQKPSVNAVSDKHKETASKKHKREHASANAG